jgi:hypothetical protein
LFGNRLQRRILGPRRDEVIGGWRKVRNEELHNLYSLSSIIRMMKLRMIWEGRVVRIVEMNVCRLSVRKPEGKRPLGRPRFRWADNIKMDLKEIG